MNKFKNCKTVGEVIKIIEYKDLEKVSYILLILWCLNPIIEYFLKNVIHFGYTAYTQFIITVVGVIGMFNYILYFYKYKHENKLDLKSTLKKYIPLFLIILLFIFALISTFFAKDKHIAIMGESYRKEGLIRYLFYAGFILASSIIKNKKYIYNILKIIVISSVLIVIIPSFNPYNTINIFNDYEFSNIYFQFNHYGYYLMICCILSLFIFLKQKNNYKKIICIGIYTILSIFLILNNTFGCILAFIITLLCLFIYCFIFKWKRKNILIVSIIFITLSCIMVDKNCNNIVFNNFKSLFLDGKTVVGYTFNKENENEFYKTGTYRGLLWKHAIDLTLKHPIVGGGIESLNHYYGINGINQDRPHNIILQISSFIGIPGAIIYIILIFYIVYNNFIKLKNKNSIQICLFFTGMCYFISSMFGNTMFYTSPYFLIILGFLISYIDKFLSKENN